LRYRQATLFSADRRRFVAETGLTMQADAGPNTRMQLDTVIIPGGRIFSERQLRIDAVRHMRQQLAADAGSQVGLSGSEDGSTVTVSLAEGGDYCLIHSGRTSCVGGYIELLSRPYALGVRKLVALIPMRCLGQIALGTGLARQLYRLPNFSVVNVAIPDPAVGVSAHVVPAGA
jgi:hypothetical protein